MIRQAFKSPVVKRYLLNTSWVMAEQVLRIISAVFVGIYIARYLGPENFGILSYSLSIAAFVMAISRLGMDAVLVRELVNKPERHSQLLGTAFWLMLATAVLCYTILLIGLYFLDEQDNVKNYVAIIAAGCFFSVFLVGDYFFQAEVKAKYSAICKTLVLFAMSLGKIWLIFIGADLTWFVIASLLDYVFLGVIFFIALVLGRGVDFLKFFDWETAREMLRSSWPMVLSAIAILIYMRIDQVMIRSMLGLHEVGIYSAATRVYEAWMTLPFVLSVSLLPLIINAKKKSEEEYHRRLIQLFRVVMWLSILAAFIVTVVSEKLMVLTFGEAFLESAPVVAVVMWTAVFAAMGSVSARYFNVEHMERKFALRTILAALLNVALNLFMIPIYGVIGAAWATLICTLFANYLMDWFDKELRVLLKLKHRAFFLR